MNTFDSIKHRCRVCALEISDLTCSIPIFGDSSTSFFLQTKISKYLYITVLEDDLLPKKICATCFLKIESIDKFAFSAAKNQECFTTWLNNKHQANVDLTQTTIETSTNSDFSFSNIIIKKEFNQRQQIVFQPQKTRNPRHVDHITLEQIINDQIIKNPKLPASTTITKIDDCQQKQDTNDESANNISIGSYHNLQIGQLIKDYELLKLILRALKWEDFDKKASYQDLIERLRRSNCRDILTNKNLLSDNDVVQLLRSYVNDSMLMNLKLAPNAQQTPHQNIGKLFQTQQTFILSPQAPATSKVVNQDETPRSEEMEFSLDPGMFLEESIVIEDDEETVSAAESKIEISKLNDSQEVNEKVSGKLVKKVSFKDFQSDSNKIVHAAGKNNCSTRSEAFKTNADLKNKTTLHSDSLSSTNTKECAIIEKPIRRKKIAVIEEKPTMRFDKSINEMGEEMADEARLKLRRKRIIIRINPSPSKLRSVREKLLPKFVCAICKKSLSSKRNLNLHHETHKDSNGKYRCDGDGCKRMFAKLDNYLKHRIESHEKTVRRRKQQNEK